MNFKLDVARHVDTDEPGVFILNLPVGFKFTHDPMNFEHVRAYDTMKELRADIKMSIEKCDCAGCKHWLLK